MSKRIMIWTVVRAAAVFLAGLVISMNPALLSEAYSAETAISQEASDILSKTNRAMAEIAAAVKPSVVNISSTRTVRTPGLPSPFFSDPHFRDFFGRSFRYPDEPRKFKRSGLGSGVIVAKDGYILTNNHVTKDADEIKIKLSDKREFKGKVIATDVKTDLAVIKIDAGNLPVLRLGDSDKLKVGETVIAVGNPYGLNQTVTSGIVSATGRADVGIADYEDFIQTDAAINPGNSGGALVNVRGELVGINTAIFSTSGGYQGIGFAIPINMAKVVMESLIKSGKVVRGWLGVSIQPVTPELAKQFGLKDEIGVLIGEVVEDSPAEKAGLKSSDLIVAFDGREVTDVEHLRNLVAGTLPDKNVEIRYIRNGQPGLVKVAIAEMPRELQRLSMTEDTALRGISVENITAELRNALGIPKRINGVIVTDIEEDSPAEGILQKNDILLEIDRKRVNTTKDYEAIVSEIGEGQTILILIYRDGSTFFVTVPAG